MTLEQFDEAKKLINEIDLVADVQHLLTNWSDSYHSLVLSNYDKSVNRVNGVSVELKDRLLDVCIQYEKELRERFEKM